MEHKTRGEHDLAWAQFAELIDQFPSYVPTYLMAGGTLIALGRPAEAAEIYRKGIATASNDPHARRELEAALAELSSSSPNQVRPA